MTGFATSLTFSVSNLSSLNSASKYNNPTCQDIKKAQIIQLLFFLLMKMTNVTSHTFQGPLKYWKSGPKQTHTGHEMTVFEWDWKQKSNMITISAIYFLKKKQKQKTEMYQWVITQCRKMIQMNKEYHFSVL